MWGILPARGFRLNHTRGVIFDNVRIEAITPDARPLFVATDSEGFVTK